MGTNYYWKPDVKALDINGGTVDAAQLKPLHIGKHSSGWEFCLQGYDIRAGERTVELDGLEVSVELGFNLSIRSWDEWKALLQRGGEIIDEYGESVTLDAFLERVEKWAAPGVLGHNGRQLLNHLAEMEKKAHLYPIESQREWVDAKGYSFTILRFS
jgi:hypothetical protein